MWKTIKYSRRFVFNFIFIAPDKVEFFFFFFLPHGYRCENWMEIGLYLGFICFYIRVCVYSHLCINANVGNSRKKKLFLILHTLVLFASDIRSRSQFSVCMLPFLMCTCAFVCMQAQTLILYARHSFLLDFQLDSSVGTCVCVYS